ncbi:hypothetical protein PAE9249_02576 [Paenibacillus sp. CECT 9249]|nr:hypothetical protein PAE9249_02576 [Paenibacillus sp. CECT 9249]
MYLFYVPSDQGTYIIAMKDIAIHVSMESKRMETIFKKANGMHIRRATENVIKYEKCML